MTFIESLEKAKSDAAEAQRIADQEYLLQVQVNRQEYGESCITFLNTILPKNHDFTIQITHKWRENSSTAEYSIIKIDDTVFVVTMQKNPTQMKMVYDLEAIHEDFWFISFRTSYIHYLTDLGSLLEAYPNRPQANIAELIEIKLMQAQDAQNNTWTCPKCGRVFDRDDSDIDGINCPAEDDRPSHWEEKGKVHPDA